MDPDVRPGVNVDLGDEGPLLRRDNVTEQVHQLLSGYPREARLQV